MAVTVLGLENLKTGFGERGGEEEADIKQNFIDQ